MMISADDIRQQLTVSGLHPELVDELIAAFSEARRNHYLGGHRLTAVEGGRFCEATFRLLETKVSGCFTPLGKQLNSDKLIQKLANQPVDKIPDSLRLHIPRTLRVIYDIRNRRDVAHLSDGIYPNTQDSSLVIACMNWVMAELVRLNHGIDADEASAAIDQLVVRSVPVIQDFEGVPRVLRKLSAGDTCLLLLFQCAPEPMQLDTLRAAIRPNMQKNYRRTLQRLDDLNFINLRDERIWITRLGERHVETERLTEPVLSH